MLRMNSEISWTSHFFKTMLRIVSDTRKAYRSWAPDHHTGIGKELNSSARVVSSDGCWYDGE